MFVVDLVSGVTQLHNITYIVCGLTSIISRFNSTTHQRLTNIHVKGLRFLWDIVACQLTSRIYFCDREKCIWRVSAVGEDIKLWLPKSPSDTFKPSRLSVTSTRLLVTSFNTHQLTQFDAEGNELSHVQLPDYINPYHAVESPTGTFIISQYNEQLEKNQLIEVNTAGQELRQFSRSLSCTLQIAVDSHGNILVADHNNRRILLLDNHLSLRRVIIDEHHIINNSPWRLCYMEQSGQLLVGFDLSRQVAVFDVLRR